MGFIDNNKKQKNRFTFTWTCGYSLRRLCRLSSGIFDWLCHITHNLHSLSEALKESQRSQKEHWESERRRFLICVARSAAKSHRGPSGALGRCHPRATEPCGGTVHGYDQRAQWHAQPHRGRTYAQRRYGSSGKRVRDGTSVGQQTLPHGRTWEHVFIL